jgi:hypothetical protein
MLTPSAPTDRRAVPRIASSRLEAAVGLTAFAPPCAAQNSVASSCLGAALVLAAPAPSMRMTVKRAACSSCLGAALVLASSSPAMRDAVARAAYTPLGAALLLALPPAHGAPPFSPHSRRNPNSLRHSQPSPTPSQRSASAHRTSYTRRWQRESRSDVGFSMSRSRWSTALGWGTYGGCVVGQDGQEILRTLHRQVRRLLPVVPLPLEAARTPHSTPLHGVHTTTEGHLECTCCSEAGSALRVRVRELPNSVVHNAALSPSCEHRWRHSSAQ